MDTEQIKLRMAKDQMTAEEAAQSERMTAQASLSGTAAAGMRSPLAQELAGIAKAGPAKEKPAGLFGSQPAPAAAGPKKPLIVDLSAADEAPASPAYEVAEAVVKGNACWKVTVSLPDVTSASEVELEVQDSLVLLLQVPDGGSSTRQISVQLQSSVDDSRVRAKFDSKKKQLVVTLPKL